MKHMIFFEENLWGTASGIKTNNCFTKYLNKNIIGVSITAIILKIISRKLQQLFGKLFRKKYHKIKKTFKTSGQTTNSGLYIKKVSQQSVLFYLHQNKGHKTQNQFFRGVFLKWCSANPSKFTAEHPWRCATRFFWNHISIWVSSWRSTAYLQETLLNRSYGGLHLKITPL